MTLSKRRRFEVFKRDGFRCMYCGRRPPDVMLECDHVHPRSEGGTDDAGNLTTSCVDCNRGKGAVGLGSVMPAIDETEILAGIQEALERAALLRRSVEARAIKKDAENEAILAFLDCWKQHIGDADVVEGPSITRFLQDLTPDQLVDAVVQTAAARQRRHMSEYAAFKYFCGVAWAWIRERVPA